MIGLTTHATDPQLRDNLARIIYCDNAETLLAKEIKQICDRFAVSSTHLYVWMEVDADTDIDNGLECVLMNADDFLFIQQIQSSMFIETSYTQSSNIRMVMVDDQIKVYWADPHRRLNTSLLAVWTGNGWSLEKKVDEWLWSCVKKDLGKWLRDSYLKLKTYSLTNKIH